MNSTELAYKCAPRIAKALVLTVAAMYLCRAQGLFMLPEKPITISVFFLSLIPSFDAPVRAGVVFLFALALVTPILISSGPSIAKLFP